LIRNETGDEEGYDGGAFFLWMEEALFYRASRPKGGGAERIQDLLKQGLIVRSR